MIDLTSGQNIDEKGNAVAKFLLQTQSQAFCANCGVRLTVHESVAGQTCAKAECKRNHLIKKLQAEAEEQALVHEIAEQRRNVFAATVVINPGLLPVAVLPANQRPLVTLPEARRQAFRTHLAEAINQVRSAQSGDDGVLSRQNTDDEADAETLPDVEQEASHGGAGLLGNGCALCGGNCCNTAGNYAYLNTETLVPLLHAQPNVDTVSIVDAYAAYFPEKAYEDSCVFHAEKGCTLPREIRSGTCNHYLCNELVEMQRVATSPDAAGACFAAAMAGRQILRSAVLSDTALIADNADQAADEKIRDAVRAAVQDDEELQ